MKKEEKVLAIVKECLGRRCGSTTVVIEISEDGKVNVDATSKLAMAFEDEENEDSCVETDDVEPVEEEEVEELVKEEVVVEPEPLINFSEDVQEAPVEEEVPDFEAAAANLTSKKRVGDDIPSLKELLNSF